MNNLDRAQSSRVDVVAAEQWQNLPKGRKYGNSKLAISEAHCSKIQLQRMGQKDGGGNSYWESPEGLNKALLTVIIDQWDYLYPIVIAKLKRKHQDDLINCQTFVDEMQAKIDKAKSEVAE